MATVTFDALDATRKLRDAGFDEKQAETVVRVLAASQESLITREHFDAKFAVIEAKPFAVAVSSTGPVKRGRTFNAADMRLAPTAFTARSEIR